VRDRGLVPGLKIALPSAAILEERHGGVVPGLDRGSNPPASGPATAPRASGRASFATRPMS
jgi:hypothetical protein